MNHQRSISSIFILLLFLLTACGNSSNDKQINSDVVENPVSAGNKKENGNAMPVMTFDKNEHDFGQVIQGEVISYSFHLKNTGNAPLVIADVTSSCGCTVGDYPKEALPPGQDGYINVTFDSKGRKGFQSKLVTVVANTIPNTKPLKITAQVVRPEN